MFGRAALDSDHSSRDQRVFGGGAKTPKVMLNHDEEG